MARFNAIRTSNEESSRHAEALRATAVAQVFSLVGLAISFLSVPIYLSVLGSDKYGLLLLANAWIGYVMVADAGVSWGSMILVAQAHGRHDVTDIASVFRHSLTLSALSGAIAIVVCVTLYAVLQDRSLAAMANLDTPDVLDLIVAAAATACVSLLFGPVYSLLIGVQDTTLTVIYQGTSRIAGQLASIALAFGGASVFVILIASAILAAGIGLVAALHAFVRYPWLLEKGSYIEMPTLTRILRVSVKSLGIQTGRRFVVNAPALVITVIASPAMVPAYTVSQMLLQAGTNVLWGYCAMLQPAFGQAWSMGQRVWIANTMKAFFRNTFVLLAGGVGLYVALGSPFISWWTLDKIATTPLLLAGLAVAVITDLALSALQFAISGMNVHGKAALLECGRVPAAFLFSMCAMWIGGVEAVGFAIGLATIVPIGILVRQLKTHLNGESIFPGIGTIASIIGVCGVVMIVATLTHSAIPQAMLGELLRIVLGGVVGILVYAVVGRIIGLVNLEFVRELRSGPLKKLPQSNSSSTT